MCQETKVIGTVDVGLAIPVAEALEILKLQLQVIRASTHDPIAAHRLTECAIGFIESMRPR